MTNKENGASNTPHHSRESFRAPFFTVIFLPPWPGSKFFATAQLKDYKRSLNKRGVGINTEFAERHLLLSGVGKTRRLNGCTSNQFGC
jgi:hypothetical protein